MPDRTPVQLFYSYAHADESLRDELDKHLSILRWEGLLTPWHDRNIQAGTKWKQEIDEHLKTADFILLLISPDFIASDYCYESLQPHFVSGDRGPGKLAHYIARKREASSPPPFSSCQSHLAL